MTRQLVLIHGRSQENRDASDLKAEWVDSWNDGLAKCGLTLPISDADIRLPYYGQTLYDLVKNNPPGAVAEIIVRGDYELVSDELSNTYDGAVAEIIERGDYTNDREAVFVREILQEIQKQSGITDEQVQALSDETITERGPLNWKWVRLILKAIDTHLPGASSTSIALATRDVYLYLKNPGFQNIIESGVRTAITPGVETVVVGHSLGSVVSYSLLRRDGKTLGWKVPLYVTLGAPLAVTAIKDALKPIKHPECATRWFNAMDSRDIVALYPLETGHFSVTPAIENKTDVDNPTENRHGISGYLSDAVVAKRIYDALTV